MAETLKRSSPSRLKHSRPTKPTTSSASALLTRSEIESLKRGKKRISDYALKEFRGWKAKDEV